MINVETVATAIFSNNGVQNGTSSSAKKNSNTSASFEDELKTAESENVKETAQEEKEIKSGKQSQKSEDKKADKKDNAAVTEKKDDKIVQNEVNEESSQTLEGELSMSDIHNINSENFSMLSDKVKTYLMQNGGQFNLNAVNLMTAVSRSEIAHTSPAVDYSSVKMSDTDAKFFSDLINKTDMSAQSVAAEFQKALEGGNVQQVQSTAKATAALIANLQESAKTNQPFRIDFDQDVSVILKVDREGKINANFIPGDKAVEAYLRNNIEFLKQRFNEENIAYGDLNYSKSRQDKEKQQKNNKEQNNE